MVLVLVLVALGVIYWVGFRNPGSGSMSAEETSFAISDTAAIQSVTYEKVVRDEVKSTLELKREADGWMVNGQYPADQFQVSNLLTTFARLTPVSVLTDAGKKTSLDRLKTNHTQVEIRGKDGILKRYKVGPTNKDQTGNIMLLEGAEEPAVISREGTQGYVAIYFSTAMDQWRSRVLIGEKPEQIVNWQLKYKAAPDRSVDLIRDENSNNWRLREGAEPDAQRVEQYFSMLNQPVHFESFAYEVYPQMPDSLRSRGADIQLSWANKTGQQTTISLFERGNDANNYFGWVEGKEELLTVQKYVIDTFLVPVDYFVPGPL